MEEEKYNYSVKLIIRNKIGFLLFFCILIILFVFLNSYFIRYLGGYIFLIIIGIISSIIFSVIVLIDILKVRKYFVNGIAVVGVIYKREELNQKNHFGIFSPSKFIIFYRYSILGEIYSSSSKIRDKNDLEYLKENTKIRILVNPNNKNDAIIMDIYEKK